MKFYKDESRNIYSFDESGSQDYLITPNLIKISEAEAEELRNLQVNSRLDYQQLRAAAYPPITDYLDAVVKGDQAGIQKYIDDCLAVKTRYPKP